MVSKQVNFVCALVMSAVVFAFASVASAASIGTPVVTPVGAGDPTPVAVSVTGDDVDHVYLVYRVAEGTTGYQSTWNTNEMARTDGTTYASSLPSLAGAVTLEWYVQVGETQSATQSTPLSANPDYNRYHDGVQYNATTAPYGWALTSQANCYEAKTPNGSKWVGNGTGIGTRNSGTMSVDTTIGMAYPTICLLNLPPSALPYIRSPKLEGGVGTIDFRAKMGGSLTFRVSEIKVQIARTESDPVEADWQNLPEKDGTYSFAGEAVSKIVHIVLNDPTVTFVRILRSQYNIYKPDDTNTGRICIDNICITKPAADVRINEKLKNPGWPAADQDIRMRCTVENVAEDTPAINRRVSVWYQYVERETDVPSSRSGWRSSPMEYRGKDNNGLDWYEGVIPTQKVGYVWYYYKVDYDGYNYGANPLTGASESISPAYWDWDGIAQEKIDTHKKPDAGRSFEVRQFRSRYGRVKLDAQPANTSVDKMNLVDNEQWQCVTLVTDVPAITNTFIGYDYYADDADAYASEPTIWSENNPDSLSDPTLAGYLESSFDGTEVTNALVTLNEKNYNGFYLYRFSSDHTYEPAEQRYDYIVKKAVYQDFDDWTASPAYFESSLGGLPTLTFAENFDGNRESAAGGAICTTNAWKEDSYGELTSSYHKYETFNDEDIPEADAYLNSAETTEQFFIRTGSRIIADRGINLPVGQKVNRTLALKLDGQIENTFDPTAMHSMPDGLEKITFKARSSIDDGKFVINKNHFELTPTTPFFVSATVEMESMAPSKPYFAFVFLYDIDKTGHQFWYECRLIQTDCNTADDNSMVAELWRHDYNETYEKVATSPVRSGNTFKLNTSQKWNFYVDSDSGKVRVRVAQGSTNPSGVSTTTANAFHLVDSTVSYGTKAGTFGFGVFDAQPKTVKPVTVDTTWKTSGTDISTTAAEWDTNLGTWTVNSSSGLIRNIPQQTIAIFQADCVGSEYMAKPSLISPLSDGSITVNQLTLQTVTVDLKAWNRKFAQIRHTGGTGAVVLDDIWYYPWRAVTRCAEDSEATVGGVKYLEWTSPDQQESWLDSDIDRGKSMRDRWAVMEGWTARNAGGSLIGANLVRSRANPALVQGVVSPVMTNGIGSANFSYSVTGGKVVYGVERSNENDYHNWTPVEVFCDNAGDSGERYVKVGKYFGGRIRLRVYGPGDRDELLEKEEMLNSAGLTCGYDPAWGSTDQDAAILFDNLKTKDYPEDKNDNAWNAYNLLVTSDSTKGPIYNGKSCIFNNNPSNGCYGAESFLDDDAYLESPPLRNVGVGEIAFQYRIVPRTGEGDGVIVIKKAKSRNSDVWETVTNVTVSASGEAFVKFDNPNIFDEENEVIRFYNDTTGGKPRYVLDNVLITAPARASFEFEYVKLLPEQPLVGSNVVVEAKIMREILSPKRIRVFCSYHKYQEGEDWGVKNWFRAALPGSGDNTIELSSMGNKVYRTPVDGGIPGGNADDLIEYVVWGIHDAINIAGGDTPITQGEDTFECPAWYETFDMEEQENKPMDMNEDHKSEGWSPYYWVFTCAPGTFFVNEINYWRASSESGAPEYFEFVGPAGTDISGWKFFASDSQATPPSEESGTFALVMPKGSRLGNANENGWGFMVWGDEWAKALMPIDHFFSGSVDWGEPMEPDPNDPDEENLASAGTVLVYRSNGMIVDKVAYGKPGDVSGPIAWGFREAGRKGTSYDDDDFYCSLSMVSLDEDGDEVPPGATVNDFTWSTDQKKSAGFDNGLQLFVDIGGKVVIKLKDPEGNEITDEKVLAWIEQYGAEQGDIDQLTMKEFNNDFLLNLNLTKECAADLKITSIAFDEGYVMLGIALTRTEGGVEVTETRKINGVLKVLGADELKSGGFTVIGDAEIGDPTFSISNATGAEIELGDEPAAFYKATIEAE